MPTPGALLNAAAARLRDAVINLDEHTWPEQNDRDEWDASLLGERGSLASTVMVSLARLLVFVEAIAKPGRFLIIADDYPSACQFLREAQRLGAAVDWIAPGRHFGWHERLVDAALSLSNFASGLRRRVAFAKRLLSRKAILSWARLRYRRPLPLAALRNSDLLCVVWGRAATFPAGARLHNETNLGRLPVLLQQAGLKNAYIVYPLTYVASMRTIVSNALASVETVAFLEDFIPWHAAFSGLLFGLAFPRKVRGFSIMGMDATSVVRAEAARDRRLAFCAEASLMRYVGGALARLGIQPRFLLHLYEAQPWEKMLEEGIRDELRNTKIIGLQHSPFASNYLSFFPSCRSLATRTGPDLLLTMGEGYAQWFRQEGMPADRVSVVGALRYERAFGRSTPPDPAVLCCTGIDLDESVDLATKAALATKQSGRRLIINYHPVTDETFRASLRAAVADVCADVAHLSYSRESIVDLIGDVDVVLYNTSAACFEAVQAGRTAIFVGRDLAIDYDKLPDSIALRCRSVEELRDLLRKPDLHKISRQSPDALREWLAPVIDAATLRVLLTGKPHGDESVAPAERGAA